MSHYLWIRPIAKISILKDEKKTNGNLNFENALNNVLRAKNLTNLQKKRSFVEK
jgi:hypothetical protein